MPLSVGTSTLTRWKILGLHLLRYEPALHKSGWAGAAASATLSRYDCPPARSAQGRGVVSAIHVREGQSVAAGQILIELIAGEVRAQERVLSVKVIGLQAQLLRLADHRTARQSDDPLKLRRRSQDQYIRTLPC